MKTRLRDAFCLNGLESGALFRDRGGGRKLLPHAPCMGTVSAAPNGREPYRGTLDGYGLGGRWSGRGGGQRRGRGSRRCRDGGWPAALGTWRDAQADLLRQAREVLDEPAIVRAPLRAVGPRLDAEAFEAAPDRLQGALRIHEELAAADALEFPSHPLEHRLARHRLGNPVERKVAIAVAFDGEAALRAQHHQVDAVLADPPVRK